MKRNSRGDRHEGQRRKRERQKRCPRVMNANVLKSKSLFCLDASYALLHTLSLRKNGNGREGREAHSAFLYGLGGELREKGNGEGWRPLFSLVSVYLDARLLNLLVHLYPRDVRQPLVNLSV